MFRKFYKFYEALAAKNLPQQRNGAKRQTMNNLKIKHAD